MSFFTLFNGNKFDLSNICAGIKINENNEFLKKYDANNNSIFDNGELEKLKEDLAPYLQDGVLDRRECAFWFAKALGLSEEALKADNEQSGRTMSDISDIVESTLFELITPAVKTDCVNYLKETTCGMSMDMLTRNNGWITQLYDNTKINMKILFRLMQYTKLSLKKYYLLNSSKKQTMAH